MRFLWDLSYLQKTRAQTTVFCFLSRKGAEATADEYQEIPLLQKGRVNFLEPVTTRNGERLLSEEKRNNRS